MRKFFTIIFILSLNLLLNSQVLIQEIYGGAGSASSIWDREVIILKNYGSSAVDISNWAIQYVSATSASAWVIAPIPGTVSLGPGQIYRFCVSGDQGVGLTPTCDGQFGTPTSIQMSGSDGRVALTTDEVAVPSGANSCPSGGNVADFVPYGNGSNCSPETPDPSATTSVVRPNAAATPDQWTVNSSPLPVELFGFSIYTLDKYSMINFSTASETNNSHFNIERSADARNFESIGEIKGAGNSSKEISYAFTDERPLPGINYYRIKQMDYDGQYSYSEIRSVRHKGISNVSITPRTTDGRVDIITELEDYSIAIYNAAGQEVKKMTGMSLDQSISIETLHAGVYFVKINSGSESETVRIVKI